MGLIGKMIGQTHVKHSGVGDAFHDMFSKTPHLVATATPERVQNFTLLEGVLGESGSKVCWHYTVEGKEQVAIPIITVDEANQSIFYKIVEGDLLDLYKTFNVVYHVDTKGEDNLVTWTLDYEKKEEDTPHPGSLLNFFLHMTEDIEAHHLSDA